jgi:hypothetical protein
MYLHLAKTNTESGRKGDEMKMLPLKYNFIVIFAALTILFSTLPATPVAASSNRISLEEFKSAMSTTNSSKVVGVYVNDVMAVRVVKQSSDSHVTNIANTVTRFGQADKLGSIGLLAHNYLAGAYFSQIDIGTKIYLVYGDGSSKEYKVTSIEQYQALSPDDPYSKFINLDEPEIKVSASNLLYEMYGTNGSLVLQTCISKEGNLTWGRQFFIASPINKD